MTTTAETTGRCRFCGCDPLAEPCRVPGGDECGWYDAARTGCSAPPCVRAYERLRGIAKAEQKASQRRRTPAEIHALICGRGRKPKKKRSVA